MKNFICILIFLCYLGSNSWGQSVIKNVIGSFSVLSANDSLVFVGGQSVAATSQNPTVNHGYLPLQYSTLDINSDQEINFILFPNPANESFQLMIASDMFFSIQIVDLSGKEILRLDNLHNRSIVDVSDLSSGVYLINLSSLTEDLGRARFIKY